ncbi:MAG TPA: hypothetical protein PK771_16280, partial [Spirochaetota bacterium]|nr:hypothetical protein [Spirochaetota bacterium]
GWKIFYGDKNNVLKRFVDAADFFKVDTIIRATGDNPLLSYEIANETVDIFYQNQVDICHLSNVPYGGGVEVVKKSALDKALKNTEIPYHLEHVTPYIYENADKFKILIQEPKDKEIARKDVKISVDTRADFEKMSFLIRNIENNDYSIKNVIKTYDKLNFSKNKRILILNDCNNDNRINNLIDLQDKLKDNFEIYFSFKNNTYRLPDHIKLINYADLNDFVEETGIFDTVIVDIGNSTKKEMNFYKSIGFVISIDDCGVGANFANFNISSKNISKQNSNYNLNGFDYSEDKEKLINIITNLSIGLNYCPYCSTKNEKPISRKDIRNMFYCKKCGLYYLTPFLEYSDIYV